MDGKFQSPSRPVPHCEEHSPSGVPYWPWGRELWVLPSRRGLHQALENWGVVSVS